MDLGVTLLTSDRPTSTTASFTCNALKADDRDEGRAWGAGRERRLRKRRDERAGYRGWLGEGTARYVSGSGGTDSTALRSCLFTVICGNQRKVPQLIVGSCITVSAFSPIPGFVNDAEKQLYVYQTKCMTPHADVETRE